MNAVLKNPDYLVEEQKFNALSSKADDVDKRIAKLLTAIAEHAPKDEDIVELALSGKFERETSTHQQDLTRAYNEQQQIHAAMKEQMQRVEAARNYAEMHELAKGIGPILKQAGVIVELVNKLQAANDRMLELNRGLQLLGIQDTPSLFFPVHGFMVDPGNEFLTINLDSYLDAIDTLKRRVRPYLKPAA